MITIDSIKQNIPIVEVLERYTSADFSKARTSQRRFNIHCPFHDDRSPSFTVYTDSNKFRCWSGCNDGRHGDVIDIVRLAESVDTKEAVNILTSDFGMSEPTEEQAKIWQKKRTEQQKLSALLKGLESQVIQTINSLKRIEAAIKYTLSAIKTIDHLEQVGELYHLLPQIDYWLDCLLDDDVLTRFEALEEAQKFVSAYEGLVMTA